MMFSKLLMIGAIVVQVASSPSANICEEETYTPIEINNIAREVCEDYDNVDPELAIAIIQRESEYDVNAENGGCVGLMQVSLKYQKSRAEEFGFDDFFDPVCNITIGVDYLDELIETYDDVYLALMLYNMKWNSAFEMYNSGKISNYAKAVVKQKDKLCDMSYEELYGGGDQ